MTPATETLLIKFMADASQYISTVQRVQHVTHNMASNIQGNLQKMSIAFSALGAFKFAGGVINEFSKFDDEMTKATAVLDSHFLMSEKLRDSALDLASSVAQTPAELARAYYDLGQAGKTANQALQTLPLFTKFATAGAMKMSDAVKLLTDVQYAMGLSAETAAEDVANLTRISDVLSKAAVKSKAEVKDFAEALSNTSAGTLRVFNKDLEAGVALLAVYADQGKRGAVAGTALTRVMLLLTAAVVKHKAAFQKKGIEIFDETGNLKSFSAIIENLDAVINNLPTEAKGGLMQGLGIKTLSQNVLLPLLGTADAIAEYDAALRDAKGTTQDMNDKVLKSFGNQLKMVWNMFTVLSIEIGERLAPGLAYLKSLAQEMINWWKSLSNEMKDFIAFGIAAALIIATLGTGLALLGMILPGLAATGAAVASIFMKIMHPVLELMHVSLYLSALWLPTLAALRLILFTWTRITAITVSFGASLKLLLGGFAGIRTLVYGILTGLVSILNPMRLFAVAAGGIKSIFQAIIGLVMFSFSPMVTLIATLLKIAAVVAILVVDAGGWVNAWNIVKKAAIDFWEWIKPIRQAIISLGAAIYESLVASFLEMGHHAMHTFQEILHWLGITDVTWTGTWENIKTFVLDSILMMEYSIKNFGEIWNIIWYGAELTLAKVIGVFSHFFTVVIPHLTSFFIKHWHEIFYDIGAFVIQFIQELGEKIGIGIGNIWAMAAGYDVNWDEFLKPMMQDFKSSISEALEIPGREVTEWEKDIASKLDSAYETMQDGFKRFKDQKMHEFSIDISTPYFFDQDEEDRKKREQKQKEDEEYLSKVKKSLESRDAALYFSSEGLSRLMDFQQQAENIRAGRTAEDDKSVQIRDAVLKGSAESNERQNQQLEQLKGINDGVKTLNKKKPGVELELGALSTAI